MCVEEIEVIEGQSQLICNSNHGVSYSNVRGCSDVELGMGFEGMKWNGMGWYGSEVRGSL